MTRLDDVQAAHDRIKQTPDAWPNLAVEHAAVPGLLAIARAAHKVDEIYEGLRTDASDGTFSIWREDDLVAALHALRPAFRDFDAALADFEAGRDG